MQPVLVNRNDAAVLATDQFRHLVEDQHVVRRAADVEADRYVALVLRVPAFQVLKTVDQVSGEDPAVFAVILSIVADVDILRAPGVGVIGGVKVDPGQDIGAVTLHTDQPAAFRKTDRAQDVARVECGLQHLEALVEGHRPHPFGELALLDVERGIGKGRDPAHVIVMRVGDEDMGDILRRHLGMGKDLARRMPVADAELVGDGLSIFRVIVADIDHGVGTVALDQDICIGQAACALVMGAVDDARHRILVALRHIRAPRSNNLPWFSSSYCSISIRFDRRSPTCSAQHPCSKSTISKPGRQREAACNSVNAVSRG